MAKKKKEVKKEAVEKKADKPSGKKAAKRPSVKKKKTGRIAKVHEKEESQNTDSLIHYKESDLGVAMQRIQDHLGCIPSAMQRQRQKTGKKVGGTERIIVNILCENFITMSALENLYFAMKVDYDRLWYAHHNMIDDVNTYEQEITDLTKRLEENGLI